MMRMGLFQQVFWRVLALLGAAVFVMVAASQVYFQQHFFDGWRADLEQEAHWIALHWGDADPQLLAQAWSRTHDAVRLSVTDAAGNSVADSDPDAGPAPRSASGRAGQDIVGSAPIRLHAANGGVVQGTLTLSRHEPLQFYLGMHRALLALMLAIVVLAAMLLYPLTEGLRRSFANLADLTRRVADGQYGATLPIPRQPDMALLVGSCNAMSLRLREAEQRKRQLLVDVSHELRSPMARLRALGETIARHPQESAQLLAQLDAEIALLDRLVGDLLETARIEQGPTALTRAPVPLAAWVADAFARHRRRIEQAGASCVVVVEDGDAEVEIDAQRLVQALGNLVENALTACAGRDARIELLFALDEQAWSIAVVDNGRGIPEEDQPFVFDRFYRAERDRGRATGGVGLGLSIVQAIVHAHGGQVRLESKPEQGTTVRMTFPRPATRL